MTSCVVIIVYQHSNHWRLHLLAQELGYSVFQKGGQENEKNISCFVNNGFYADHF